MNTPKQGPSTVDPDAIEEIQTVGLVPESYSDEERNTALSPLLKPETSNLYATALLETPEGTRALAQAIPENDIAEFLENMTDETANKVVKVGIFENSRAILQSKDSTPEDKNNAITALASNLYKIISELKFLEPAQAENILNNIDIKLLVSILNPKTIKLIRTIDGWADGNAVNIHPNDIDEDNEILNTLYNIDYNFFMNVLKEIEAIQEQAHSTELYTEAITPSQEVEEAMNHAIRFDVADENALYAENTDNKEEEAPVDQRREELAEHLDAYIQTNTSPTASSAEDIDSSRKALENSELPEDEKEKWANILAGMDEETKKSEEGQDTDEDEYGF